MIIGVSLKIDVTKIDKEKLYKGQKGTYLDATAFIDVDNLDQYGNSGMITQSVSKEDREAGVKGAILGNSKVFMKKGGEQQQSNAAPTGTPPPVMGIEDDDIPF